MFKSALCIVSSFHLHESGIFYYDRFTREQSEDAQKVYVCQRLIGHKYLSLKIMSVDAFSGIP